MAITNDTTWGSDVTALKSFEDISTTSAMGKIAEDANGGKPTVLIHSGDKSYDELIAEYKGSGGSKAEIAEASVHAADLGMEVAGVEVAGGAAVAAAIFLPVAGLALGMYKLAEANARGRELNHALARDEQHVAMLTNLALPQQFVQQELTKYSHAAKSFQAASQKMTTQIHGQDHALAAVVQLHCDQGMNAARDMCEARASGAGDAGTAKSDFFAAHPDVAKRYASDAAFKAGFDAVSWAHDKGGETYSGLVNDVASRDARYGAAGVAWRV